MSGRGHGMLPAVLVAVALGMTGLSFAAVPLYRLFCAVTGYGGTPAVGPQQAPGAAGHVMTVRFDADTESGLPWHFQPEQTAVTLPVGKEQVAFYAAENLASEPVTGVALYNVTPEKIGRYFHKTACFCFDRQTLQAGQQMQFPVSFWIDPAIARDPGTADVRVITLSYTFYRSLDDAAKSGALAEAGPHVGPESGRLGVKTPGT